MSGVDRSSRDFRDAAAKENSRTLRLQYRCPASRHVTRVVKGCTVARWAGHVSNSISSKVLMRSRITETFLDLRDETRMSRAASAGTPRARKRCAGRNEKYARGAVPYFCDSF